METIVPAGDATAVVIYSHRTFAQAIRNCTASKLAAVGLDAKSQTNFVQLFDETQKGPGDTIKYDLIPNAQGPGVLGDALIAGHEVPYTALQDTFIINQLRQAHLLDGVMSQQRVPYSMRDAAKTSLANWSKEAFDCGLMNQLGGNTYAQTSFWGINMTGLNAVVAPTTDHHFIVNHGTVASGAAETDLVPGDVFSIEVIPQIVSMAQTYSMPIKPTIIKGIEIAGVLFLTAQQVRDMKRNYTPGEWGDIYGRAMQGGQITGNPIFTGAIGMIENVVIHQDTHVPWGNTVQNTVTVVNPDRTVTTVAAPNALGVAATGVTSVGRGVFVGAQAACLAFGGYTDGPGGEPLRMRWVEELLDAGNQLRVTAGMIFGIHKTQFNSSDYATIVISSYNQP